MNRDFAEMLSALCAAGAEFLAVLTGISGVAFNEAWPRRTTTAIGSLSVPVLGLDDLLTNKRATGRPKDQADVVWLESKTRA